MQPKSCSLNPGQGQIIAVLFAALPLFLKAVLRWFHPFLDRTDILIMNRKVFDRNFIPPFRNLSFLPPMKPTGLEMYLVLRTQLTLRSCHVTT